MNFDANVKYINDRELAMPVLEHFLSCNGEGIDVGKPVTFVRLVGCNLRCRYGKCGHCDTPESLLFPCQRAVKDYEYMTAKQVAEVVKSNGAKRVTLTGGNPLSRGQIGQWIKQLLEELGEGYLLEIEENGSVDLNLALLRLLDENERKRVRITLDYKALSSGMNPRMYMKNWEMLQEHDVIKCVVGNEEDMLDAVKKIQKIQPRAQIIFSPIFGEIEPVEIWEFIQRPEIIGLDIKFQLQLHKFVYDPNLRGV